MDIENGHKLQIRGEIYERFRARAIDKKRPAHKQVVGTAYFLARNDDEAEQIAPRKLKDAGVQGRHYIRVEPYYPWLDSAFHGYIRRVEQ